MNKFINRAITALLTIFLTFSICFVMACQAAPFVIHFESNGGTQYQKVISNTGVELPTPEKAGYIFDGWYESEDLSGESIPSPFMPEKDATIYAKWTAISGKIIFESNGGTEYSPIEFSAQAVNLPTPTRENYVFSGWYKSADFSGEKVEGQYLEQGEVTLYAKWIYGDSAIFFDSNGSTAFEPVFADVENGVNLPIPTLYGYKFLGWFINESDETAVESPYFGEGGITLTAKWEKVTYVYLYYGESTDYKRIEGKVGDVLYTSEFFTPEDIMIEHYVQNFTAPFVGWVYEERDSYDGIGDAVGESITLEDEHVILVAKYDYSRIPATDKIKKNDDGSLTVTGIADVELYKSANGLGKMTFDVTMKKGNTMATSIAFRMDMTDGNNQYWSAGSTYLDASLIGNGDIQFNILRAGTRTYLRSTMKLADMPKAWQDKINAVNNGEMVTATLAVENYNDHFNLYIEGEKFFTYGLGAGESAIINEFKGKGFGFRCSQVGSTYSNFKFETIDEYVLLNGEEIVHSNYYLEGTPITTVVPDKSLTGNSTDGYSYLKFVGWYDSKEGGNKVETYGEAKTLYARFENTAYEGKAYDVSFVTNIEGLTADKIIVVENASVNLPALEKDSYRVEWYIDGELTQKYNGKGVTSDLTLYAKWIETVNVIFKDEKGVTVEEQTVDKGSVASLPTEPTKESVTHDNGNLSTFTLVWYNGENRVNAQTTFGEDSVLIAKYDETVTRNGVLITQDENGDVYTINDNRASLQGVTLPDVALTAGEFSATITVPKFPTASVGFRFGFLADDAGTLPFTGNGKQRALWVHFNPYSGGVELGSKVYGNGENGLFSGSISSIKDCNYKTKFTQAKASGEGYSVRMKVIFTNTYIKYYVDDCLLFVYGDESCYEGETIYGKYCEADHTTSTLDAKNQFTPYFYGTEINTNKVNNQIIPKGNQVVLWSWQNVGTVAGNITVSDIDVVQYSKVTYVDGDETVATEYLPKDSAVTRVLPSQDITDDGNGNYIGQKFIGWFDAKEGGNKIETVNGDITVYARYEQVVAYKVSFETNKEGVSVAPVIASNGEDISSFVTAPKTINYYFIGWYYDEGLTESADLSAIELSANTTLYAKWGLISDASNSYDSQTGAYTFTATSQYLALVDVLGGMPTETNPIMYSSVVVGTKGTSRGGFSFRVNKGNGNTTAQYENYSSGISYYVNFNSGSFQAYCYDKLNGEIGSSNNKHLLGNGTTAGVVSVGNTPTGWQDLYNGSSSGDLLTIKLIVVDYGSRIEFYVATDLTSNGKSNELVATLYNQGIQADGYSYVVGQTGAGGTTYYLDTISQGLGYGFALSKGPIVFTEYSLQTLNTVTYKNDEQTVAIDAFLSSLDITRELPNSETVDDGNGNYSFDKFVGWFDAKEGGNKVETVNSTTTVYARFETVVTTIYTVKFDVNRDGVTGVTVEDVLVPKGESFVLPEAPIASGYRFDGWFVDEGYQTAYVESVPTGNFTLYAKWVKQVAVTFVLDERVISTQVIDVGTTATFPESAQTYTHSNLNVSTYSISGWTLNGESVSADTAFAEDGEVIATFTEVEKRNGIQVTQDENGDVYTVTGTQTSGTLLPDVKLEKGEFSFDFTVNGFPSKTGVYLITVFKADDLGKVAFTSKGGQSCIGINMNLFNGGFILRSYDESANNVNTLTLANIKAHDDGVSGYKNKFVAAQTNKSSYTVNMRIQMGDGWFKYFVDGDLLYVYGLTADADGTYGGDILYGVRYAPAADNEAGIKFAQYFNTPKDTKLGFWLYQNFSTYAIESLVMSNIKVTPDVAQTSSEEENLPTAQTAILPQSKEEE